MEIKTFLESLKERDLYLVVEADKLILKIKPHANVDVDNIKKDDRIREYIQIHRDELINHIQKSGNSADEDENVIAMFKLSGLQEGMLFHSLLDDKSATHVGQLKIDFENLDLQAFIEAWQRIIDIHQVFRTFFSYEDFKFPIQCVVANVKIPLTLHDLAKRDEDKILQELEIIEEGDRLNKIALKAAPLFHLSLVKLPKGVYRLIFTHHLIIFDGWSISVLLKELIAYYKQILNGEIIKTKEQDTFEDYIKYLKKRSKQAEQRYWKSYLSGYVDNFQLPFLKGQDLTKTIESGQFIQKAYPLKQEVYTKIIDFCKEQRITVNTFMQGVWAFTLSCFSNRNDICFGITVSGRPFDLPEVENKIGPYINTIPFFNIIDRSKRVKHWLREIHERQASGFSFQLASLLEIKQYLNTRGDMFDSLLVFENYPLKVDQLIKDSSITIKQMEMWEHTNFPLSLTITKKDSLHFNFVYNEQILSPSYFSLIAEKLSHVIDTFLENPSQQLKDIPIVSLEEKRKITYIFNKLPKPVADDHLIDLFQNAVKKFPQHIALAFDDQQITYEELDRKSNLLAHYLKKQGTKSGDLVPICCERSVEMVLGILSVLKTGGAYVPIDPQYPQARITFILKDVAAEIVLCGVEEKALFDNNDVKSVVLDWNDEVLEGEIVSGFSGSDSLAYVIYTSGSSGRPKGVMIDHRAIVNRLLWAQSYFGVGSEDRILQKTTFCFDVSVWEIFLPLISGAKLILARPSGHKDHQYLYNLIQENAITMVHFVPPMLEAFLQDIPDGACTSLKSVICSGESLKKSHVKLFKQKRLAAQLFNLYGPTEAAIDVTSWNASEEEGNVLIGKPVDNTIIHIIDRNNRMLPIGSSGELVIGGVQVFRGYLNQTELFEKSMVPLEGEGQSKERFYKTGDLARWLPDGNIEYLGRIDTQVKIRGFRVELEEIDNVMMDFEGVKQASTIYGEIGKNNWLLAAFIVYKNQEFNEEGLRYWLKARLPTYMNPSLFIRVDELPLTINGKIDKRILESRLMDQVHQDKSHIISPKDEVEHEMISIWRELLGLDQISTQDDFFLLGGDSIKIIRLLGKVNNQFGCDLQLIDVYRTSTLAALAALITEQLTSKAKPVFLLDIEKAKSKVHEFQNELLPLVENGEFVEGIFPMSDIQRGMVYAYLTDPSVGMYHDQFVYPFFQHFDPQIFEEVLAILVDRHATLRTVFDLDICLQGAQIIYKEVPFTVKYHEVATLSLEALTQHLEDYLSQSRGSLDLRYGPLWFIEVFKSSYGTLLVFQCHHSILDGWSLASFTTELNNIYNKLSIKDSIKLEPLKASISDHAIESMSDTEDLVSKERWNQALLGYKRLDIFNDQHIFDKESRVYNAKFLDKLKRKVKSDKLSLKAVFFGAYLYGLKTLTFEEELTVGLVSNTRPLVEDGDRILGCFLNTIPVRKKFSRESTWRSYFGEIEAMLKELKGLDRTSLFKIAKSLGENDIHVNPFFDTIFDFLDFHIYEEMNAELSLKSKFVDEKLLELQHLNYTRTNTFLDCVVEVTGDQLSITYFQQRGLKSGKEIKYLLDIFQQVLLFYLDHFEEEIDRSEILPEKLTPEASNNLLLKEETIVNLFQKQVSINGDMEAIVFQGVSISYYELNDQANCLANHLISLGVCKEDLVPFCLDRSPLQVIAILGILKAGAAYVPIDVDLPEERINYILKATKSRLFLCDNRSTHLRSLFDDITLVNLELRNDILTQESSEEPIETLSPENLAYVIFTSGSTGEPKGVMIEHRGVVNLAMSQREPLNLHTGVAWLQFASIGFDASCYEIFCTLLNGGKLIMVPKNVLLNIEEFTETINRNHVEVITVPPSYITMINWGFTSVKTLVSAGEALHSQQVNYVTEQGIKIINAYGPTENSVCATLSEAPILEDNHISIGKPIDNVQVFILDANREILPNGVIGEIYLAGMGLARGYLNNEALTSDTFFETTSLSRIYKTGDLGKIHVDGSLEYIGRVDNQVKIRGFRVELEEVEAVIKKSGFVKEVVVSTKKIGEYITLIAYVLRGDDYSVESLMAFLKQKLPDYMIPDSFFLVEEFLFTINGKIDRKALSQDKIPLNTDFNVESQSIDPLEVELAEIWKKILEVDHVGPTDDFFQLGGHSLIAVRLISTIRKQYKLEMTIADFFALNTVQKLSKFIRVNSQNTAQEKEDTSFLKI